MKLAGMIPSSGGCSVVLSMPTAPCFNLSVWRELLLERKSAKRHRGRVPAACLRTKVQKAFSPIMLHSTAAQHAPWMTPRHHLPLQPPPGAGAPLLAHACFERANGLMRPWIDSPTTSGSGRVSAWDDSTVVHWSLPTPSQAVVGFAETRDLSGQRRRSSHQKAHPWMLWAT